MAALHYFILASILSSKVVSNERNGITHHKKYCVYTTDGYAIRFTGFNQNEKNVFDNITMQFCLPNVQNGWCHKIFERQQVVSNCTWKDLTNDTILDCDIDSLMRNREEKFTYQLTGSALGALFTTKLVAFSYLSDGCRCEGYNLKPLLSTQIYKNSISLAFKGFSSRDIPSRVQQMLQTTYYYYTKLDHLSLAYGNNNVTQSIQSFIRKDFPDCNRASTCRFDDLKYCHDYKICLKVEVSFPCRAVESTCQVINLNKSCTTIPKILLINADKHSTSLTAIEGVCVALAIILFLAVVTVILRNKYYNGEICQRNYSEGRDSMLDDLSATMIDERDQFGEYACNACTANNCHEHLNNEHALVVTNNTPEHLYDDVAVT